MMIMICHSYAQSYVINTSWEDGNVVPVNAGTETTTTYGQDISTDYVRSGSHSCRFEVHDSDPKYGGGVRSEQKTDMIFDQTQGDVAWIGYSIYYPSNMVNTPQEEMIGQCMQTTSSGSYSPALGFKNEGDFSLRCYVRQGSRDVIKNLPAFSFPKGEWVDFVWNIKFSLNNDGYIKGWCNGELKVDYSGKVGYPGSKINFKWGIYPGWKSGPNGQSPRIIYWDNLKVMRNNGAYDLVNPGTTGGKLDQTITFPSIPTKLSTDPDFDLGATASSGLPVAYASSNTAVATIQNGNVHIVGIGTSIITASQAGNSNYNPAPDESQLLTVLDGTGIITSTINPIHDAYVRDDNTADGTGPDLITKNGSTGYKRETYLMYDLSAAGITSAMSATLRLYCNLDDGGRSDLYSINNDAWSEAGITWGSRPVSGSLIGSLSGNTGYMEWDVTSFINNELSGDGKASFRVLATDDAFIDFNSKEAGSNLPELVITGSGTTQKTDQTITFDPIPDKLTTDSDFDPGAIASSGLPVSYVSSNTAVATILSGNIHIVGAGTSTITASQAGDETYNPAPDVSQVLTVLENTSGGTSGIINPIHDAFVRDDNTADGTGTDLITKNGWTGYKREAFLMFDLAEYSSVSAATLRLYCNLDDGGNSELYRISNDTWTETSITWSTKPATGSLIDSKSGNIGYMEWDVTAYVNDDLAVNDKVSFRLVATDDAFIYFNSKEAASNKPELVITGTGGLIKQDQAITFNTLPDKLVTDADFDPGATASSGLDVSYTSSNTSVATIVNGLIHITGAGTSTITASQAGDENYNLAQDVSRTLTVNKLDQSITFDPIPDKYTTDPDFDPVATASSGLTVTYSSSNTAVATIVSGNIHILGAGSSVITAMQAGDATYNPAADVTRTLIVTEPTGDIPDPWTATDIENPAIAGSTTWSNGIFTVEGAGADVWGTSDQCQFVYQILDVDTASSASCNDVTANPVHDAYVQSNGTADGTGIDLVTKNAGGGYYREAFLMFDLSTYDCSSATSATLRLYCNRDDGGNSELYKVADDSWTETGITWSNRPAAGVLISSFPANTGYMEWDVSSYINEELTGDKVISFLVRATADAIIQFNSSEASSNKPELVVLGGSGTANADGSIIVKVNSITNTDLNAKAGIMIRESLDANSKMAYVSQRPNKEVAFDVRTSTGGTAVHTASGFTGGTVDNKWLKIERTGDVFSAFYSTISDSGPWTELYDAQTIPMNNPVYIGMFVTSHDASEICTGVFSDVQVTGANLHKSTIIAPVEVFGNESVRGQFKVYPNPYSSGNLMIQAEEISDGILKIINPVGQIVYSTPASQNMEVERMYFTSRGLYIVTIQDESGIQIQKLIVY